MTQRKLNYFWVKRFIKVKEWNEFYSQVPAYSILDKSKDGIMVGFLSAGGVPADCGEITDDEELRLIDLARRANNQRPYPFKEVTL
jgi:hypothetical protein